MKRYSRKGLIAFFSRMKPRSRPCTDTKEGIWRCPIEVYMDSFDPHPWDLDCDLAYAIDIVTPRKTDGSFDHKKLTAKQIVDIAKSLEGGT